MDTMLVTVSHRAFVTSWVHRIPGGGHIPLGTRHGAHGAERGGRTRGDAHVPQCHLLLLAPWHPAVPSVPVTRPKIASVGP